MFYFNVCKFNLFKFFMTTSVDTLSFLACSSYAKRNRQTDRQVKTNIHTQIDRQHRQEDIHRQTETDKHRQTYIDRHIDSQTWTGIGRLREATL